MSMNTHIQRPKAVRRRGAALLAAATMVAGVLALAPSGVASATSTVTLSIIANVNPELTEMQHFTPAFERANPGIKVKYDILPEDESRPKVLQDLSTHAGEFDIVMIDSYDTPIYAKNGWLENLTPFLKSAPAYDVSDLIPTAASNLSYQGSLYALPFYTESSFLMYRKDLFAKAGLKMPLHPTWSQVAQFAKTLNDPSAKLSGICLRGEAGYGENMAVYNMIVDTFGGRFFNMQWKPQLLSAPVVAATNFYVNLLRKYGEPGAATAGWSQCLNAYVKGHTAMWVDATSLAPAIATESKAMLANTGFAYAPVAKTKYSGWLYTLGWGIPVGTAHPDQAFKYISYMTSRNFIHAVGLKYGWASVPPGTRKSTYAYPGVKSAPFSALTLASIAHADASHPSIQPTPYTGINNLNFPQWVTIGNFMSNELSGAIAGKESVRAALTASQAEWGSVMSAAGYR